MHPSYCGRIEECLHCYGYAPATGPSSVFDWPSVYAAPPASMADASLRRGEVSPQHLQVFHAVHACEHAYSFSMEC